LLSSKVGHSLDPLVFRLYRFFFRSRNIKPNVITFVGLLFALIAAACIARGRLLLAGILLLFSGILDVLDGAVARNTNTVSSFGGFFDSVLDRYSDLLVMLGILLFFLRIHDAYFVMLTGITSVGVAVIPYARARAEAEGISCKNGLMERPERLILLVLGLCFDALRITTVLLAVLTHVTVVQRVLFVRGAMKNVGFDKKS
jgi:CDP-diacylglycerol--glycerol-3-phosphate 3-phosphatidyltransferase